MSNKHVLHVMKNEWAKTMKTKSQLLLLLLTPLITVMFISWGLDYVISQTSTYEAAVFFQNEEQMRVADVVLKDYPSFAGFVGGDPKTDVTEGKIDCALVVDDQMIHVYYDSELLSSSTCLKDASDVADALCFAFEGTEVYNDMKDFMPTRQMIDLSSKEDILETFLDRMTGLIGMLIFLTMASNALSLSANSVTGEKERHTFDTMVLCPASLRKILLGKTLVLMVEIFLSGLVGILTGILAFAIWSHDQFSTICELAGKNLAWLPLIILLLLSATLVTTAVFMTIASAFSQTKKASLFSSAGMVLISVSSMIPTFTKNEAVKFFPVANWSIAIKSICRGKGDLAAIGTGFLISVLIFALGLVLSSALWERTNE
ncbi:MAG: ABC transporter permease subunit [Clostridiales bacterium]|nr:ABC transporter permease subunit [Clostridiales bacterium]